MRKIKLRTSMVLVMYCISFTNCRSGDDGSGNGTAPTTPPVVSDPTFELASATNLPLSSLQTSSMDVEVGDLNGDGNPDIAVAMEFVPNVLLINDGRGKFSVSQGLPAKNFDSEDVGIADFDGDGDLDLIFVSEDNQENEFYLNDGEGNFTDASDRIPVQGTSNAVAVEDINGDGHLDIVIGNSGQNVVLINDGAANFQDRTSEHLPALLDATQDIEFGDIDGDGDRDLLVGNEDANRILVNDGSGKFIDESSLRLPSRDGIEETREADFGDIDGDGDLDIFFANVGFKQGGAAMINRLLTNDGTGNFFDSNNLLPDEAQNHTVDADFADIDDDDDLDLILINAFGGPHRLFVNENGSFSDGTSIHFPSFTGSGIDAEAHDFNKDGKIDIYISIFQASDHLLLAK